MNSPVICSTCVTLISVPLPPAPAAPRAEWDLCCRAFLRLHLHESPDYLRSVLLCPEASTTLASALSDVPLDYVGPIAWVLFVLGRLIIVIKMYRNVPLRSICPTR